MEFAITGLSTSVALAAVACLGYLLGRSQLRAPLADRAHRQIRDANQVLLEVQAISDDIRRSLAAHHSSIALFEKQLRDAGSDSPDSVTKIDSHQLLQPTQRMSGEIAATYDRIRQQSQVLGRLRRETGVLRTKNTAAASDH